MSRYPENGRVRVYVCHFLLLLVERRAVNVAQAHGGHAGHDVKSDRDANDVEVVVRSIGRG